MRHSLVPLALLTLAACSSGGKVNVINNNLATPTPGPAVAAAPASGTLAAAALPSAPVGRSGAIITAFDGTWGLNFTTDPEKAKQCPAPPSREVPMQVKDGNATLNMGKVYAGRPNEGGEVRLVDRLDPSILIIGQFQGERFVGDFRNGACRYAAAGRKMPS